MSSQLQQLPNSHRLSTISDLLVSSLLHSHFQYVTARFAMLVKVSGCSVPSYLFLSSITSTCNFSASFHHSSACMLQPGLPCLSKCQDVQHQVTSSSAPSHQLAASLLHSIFPAAC